MKKIISLFPLLALLLTSCVSPSSTNTDPDKKHLHSLQLNRTFERHYLECSICHQEYNPDLMDYFSLDDESQQLIANFPYSEYEHAFEDCEISSNGYHKEKCRICDLVIKVKDEKEYNSNQHWEVAINLDDNKTHKFRYEDHYLELDPDGSVEPTYETSGYDTERCTQCDYYHKVNIVPALEHTFEDKWSYDENGHWHRCLDEGYEDAKLDYKAHTPKQTIDESIPDSYCFGGLKYDICECGAIYNYRYSESPMDYISEPFLSYDPLYPNTAIIGPDKDGNYPTDIAIPEYVYSEKMFIYDVKIFDEYLLGEESPLNVIYLPKTYGINLSYFVHSGHENDIANLLNLRGIIFHPDHPKYKSSDIGVVYNRSMTELIYYPSGESWIDSRYIPSTLRKIDNYAFMNSKIEEYITPSSLVEIDHEAFLNCKSLKKVTITENVRILGAWLFRGCDNLTTFELYSSLLSINSNTFIWTPHYDELFSVYNGSRYLGNPDNPYFCMVSGSSIHPDCKKITSLTNETLNLSDTLILPDGINSFDFDIMNSLGKVYTKSNHGYYIGTSSNPYLVLCEVDSDPVDKFVFHEDCRIAAPYCLSKLELNDNGVIDFNKVEVIESSALPKVFNKITANIYLRNNIKYLGYGAFSSSIYTTNIFYEFESVDKFINDLKLNVYPVTFISKETGDPVTEIVIPDTTTFILDFLFAYTKGIKKVTIPTSVEYIGQNPFPDDCELYYSGTIDEWGRIQKYPYAFVGTVHCSDGDVIME